MIPPRELAAQLAGSVLDHVERERNLVRHSIEEVLYDALLLAQAKAATPTVQMIGGAASQEVADAAKRVCTMIINDSSLWGAIPKNLGKELDELYRTLRLTGWTP